MHKTLIDFIQFKFDIDPTSWAQESYELSSEETFQEKYLQNLFKNTLLRHRLFYSVEVEHAFYPFEISLDNELIALGYMINGEQRLTYLNLDPHIKHKE